MELKLRGNCPNCSEKVELVTEVSKDLLSSRVRSNIKPVGTVDVYKITSEDMKQFITQKAKQYIPGITVEVVSRYIEKRRKNKLEQRRSFASLRIAFSGDVVERSDQYSFYEKMIDADTSPRIIRSVFNNIIKLYEFNKEDLDLWMDNYRNLEFVEQKFGITQNYINDIKNYSIPKRIVDANGKQWVIFSADCEKVIKDMLTEVTSNQIQGRIQIMEIYPISKDVVEFIIYLYPDKLSLEENTHVRQILTGNDK